MVQGLGNMVPEKAAKKGSGKRPLKISSSVRVHKCFDTRVLSGFEKGSLGF